MISQKDIEDVKEKLVKAYSPLEIYLIGSYAWGNPTKDSDLDLFVVVETSDKKRYERPVVGYLELMDFMFPKEIIVYTKAEFEEALKDKNSFSHKICEEGKRIYAKA
ncbi:MAG: nucleotidyltransferase domain-containing protein [bacterium]